MPNRFSTKTKQDAMAENSEQSVPHISRKEKLSKISDNIKLKRPQKPKANPKSKAVANKGKSNQNKVSSNKLKLLFTIVARSKAEYFLDLIQSFDVNMQIAMLANGMAPKSMLDLLGLANSEKVVIASVIQESKINDVLSAIDEKFNTIKGGKGIAFTVPLTSVIGTLIYGFLSNNKMAVKEEKSKWTNQNTN